MDDRARLANTQTLMVYVTHPDASDRGSKMFTCSVLGNAKWPPLQRTYVRREGETYDHIVARCVRQVRCWKVERGLEYPVVISPCHLMSTLGPESADRLANMRAGLFRLAHKHASATVRVAALVVLADAMGVDADE